MLMNNENRKWNLIYPENIAKIFNENKKELSANNNTITESDDEQTL